jgi:hypothetical protein
MTPPPSIETTTACMMDVIPPVHRCGDMLDKKHAMLLNTTASDLHEPATSPGSVFDAIWQYNNTTELLLCRVRHKHTKINWVV